MLLSRRTVVKVDGIQSNILGHLCHAAQKLWNVGNYEKRNYKDLGFEEYPDWYDQKKRLKTEFWYKNLPSQTAQEILKELEGAWKSFFALKKTGGVKNPQPPRFKKDKICVTYMQNGIMHNKDSKSIRFAIPKQLKEHLNQKYNIHADYLYLENKIFSNMDTIKQIQIYPPADGTADVIIVYEIPDVEKLPDNGKYLSMDIGVHNPITCYDNVNHASMFFARKYASICYYYDKQIAHYQGIAASQQAAKGVKHPKCTKRVLKLYKDKRNSINDLFHKTTKHIADYCEANDIHTAIIGDITHIRDNNNMGAANNQTFHSLPFAKIYAMLEYKLAMRGITLVKVKESFSSQCSPLSEAVNKKHALKSNRKYRGLYVDGFNIWNADSVGAYNIMRIYAQAKDRDTKQSTAFLSNPIKVSV